MKGGSSNSNCNKHHHHQPQQQRSSTTEANYNESMTEYNPEIQAPSSQLSSAYIRTLVKHLTATSTVATATTTPSRNKGKVSNNSNGNNMGCMAEQGGDGASHPPPAARKKQVRRRLHTSRPYQERLLNMAEARKEIVAALKFHRASMKQQQQQQQQQHHSPPALPGDMIGISSPMDQQDDPDHRYVMSMNNNYSSFPSYHDSNTHINDFNKWSYDSPQYGYQCPWQSWPLPSQSLGLNLSLNYQNFSNLDPNFINLLQHKELIPSTSTSPSPSSPSSSSPPPPPLSYTTGNINTGGIATDGDAESHGSGLYLHQALDEEEMAVIRSVGEQHQMEWNDTLNLVTSAWWCNYLSKMDLEMGSQGNEDPNHSFPSEYLSSDDFSHGAAPPW
ncbi:hypothetical protein Droror1_Dr00015417 [Drosera rotundifolia]